MSSCLIWTMRWSLAIRERYRRSLNSINSPCISATCGTHTHRGAKHTGHLNESLLYKTQLNHVNIVCSVRPLKNPNSPFPINTQKGNALQVRRNRGWQQDRFWEAVKQKWEGWEGERGERGKKKQDWRGEASSYSMNLPSFLAIQLSSALTNLDVACAHANMAVLFCDACVAVPPACLPNRAGQSGQVSVRRLTAVTHTVLYRGHTCCHSCFRRAWLLADRWAEHQCYPDTDLHTLNYPPLKSPHAAAQRWRREDEALNVKAGSVKHSQNI